MSTKGDCTLIIAFHAVHLKLPAKSESCHLQKYSNDSAVVCCITDIQEDEYRELVFLGVA